MSARLDRNALKADVPAIRGAWDDTRQLMQAVSAYVSALESVDFGPVPVQGASIDLFYKVPKLRPTLLTAREHAQAWTRIGTGLFNNIILGMHMFALDLGGVTTTITATVNAATAARRPLTASERASIVTSLKRLEAVLSRSVSDLTSQQSGVVTFIRGIADDASPLQYGSEDLGQAIQKIEQATLSEALKYFKPDSQGIYNLILDWGRKILERLRALQVTLNPLSAANERSQHAIQGMLTIWATVKEKYVTVIDVLSQTQVSVDDFATLPDLLEVATLSWKDVTDYVKP